MRLVLGQAPRFSATTPSHQTLVNIVLPTKHLHCRLQFVDFFCSVWQTAWLTNWNEENVTLACLVVGGRSSCVFLLLGHVSFAHLTICTSHDVRWGVGSRSRLCARQSGRHSVALSSAILVVRTIAQQLSSTIEQARWRGVHCTCTPGSRKDSGTHFRQGEGGEQGDPPIPLLFAFNSLGTLRSVQSHLSKDASFSTTTSTSCHSRSALASCMAFWPGSCGPTVASGSMGCKTQIWNRGGFTPPPTRCLLAIAGKMTRMQRFGLVITLHLLDSCSGCSSGQRRIRPGPSEPLENPMSCC